MGSFPRQSFPRPDQVKNSHMLQNVGTRRGFCLLAPGFTPWPWGYQYQDLPRQRFWGRNLVIPFSMKILLLNHSQCCHIVQVRQKIHGQTLQLPKVVPVAVAASASAGASIPGGVNVILLHFQFCVHSLETFGGLLYIYIYTWYAYELCLQTPSDNLTSGILLLRLQRK